MASSKARARATASPWSMYRWTGFKEPRNLTYYLILSGISVAFIAFMYRSMFVKSVYCNPHDKSMVAPPGECYYYMQPGSRYYWGIQVHLSTCFPALGLAVLQFTPRIRQKFPRFHRYAGRISMVLGIVSSISTFLFVDVAMGGTWPLITVLPALAALSVLGSYKGWTSIRAGDIDLHRRWMLRTWSWMGCIITMRPFVALGVILVSALRNILPTSIEMSCAKLLHMTVMGKSRRTVLPINVFKDYPEECVRSEFLSTNLTSIQEILQTELLQKTHVIPWQVLEALNPNGSVSIPASLASKRIDQTMAAGSVSFGLAAWSALIIHAVLVEVYLSRTKNEDDRLKRVSTIRKTSKMKGSKEEGLNARLVEAKKSS